MNRIKSILEEKGIKQTWLAEKLNKSYNMVNSYVQNRRQPSIENLFKIANILNIKPSVLINDNYCPDCNGTGYNSYPNHDTVYPTYYTCSK